MARRHERRDRWGVSLVRQPSSFGPRPRVKVIAWLAGMGVLLWIGLPRATAQMRPRSYPNDLYYAAYRLYYEGEYRDAGSAFRRAARGGVVSSRGRWIDSICYYTMMGECLYRMGKLDQALEQYGAALQLALQHEGWTARIRWPERIDVSQATIPRPPTWGPSQRNRPLARIPRKMQIVQGDVDTATSVASGGLLQQRFYMTIDAQEVLRCTALALRRRRQILGPLSRYDRLHGQVSDSLARMTLPPNHWARVWRSALVGVALAAEGKLKEAVGPLQQSLSIGNTLDHSLTSLALLELGDIAFAQDRYPEALQFYYEATFPAAKLELYDDVAEGILGAARVHLALGRDGVYAPLASAASWAHRDSEAAEARLWVAAAENAVAVGNVSAAEKMLAQATRAMARTDMPASPLGGRFQYVLAQVRLKQGKAADAQKAFAKALQVQRASGLWLFQLATADRLITRGRVSARVGADLYQRLLRVPDGKDWQSDPLDALAYLTTPMEEILERWFELSLKRKETEKALWISERIRQHRFLRSQPLGGRLLALRWILSAPAERLSPKVLAIRQDLLNRCPAYRTLETQAEALRNKLRSAMTDEEGSASVATVSQQLAAVSDTQESLLWDIALARVDAPLIVPRVATLEEIQEALREDERAIVFFQTRRAIHLIVVRGEDYSIQTLGSPKTWRSAIAMWLRSMNLADGHRSAEFQPEKLEAWKQVGEKFTAQFAKAFPGGLWGDAKRITIVPDGSIWYLPFGALPDESGTPLIARARLRFLPLLSLVAEPGTPPRRDGVTVVVRGRFYPKDQEEAAGAAIGELTEAIPGVKVVDRLEVPANLVLPAWDRLVVLAPTPRPSETQGGWALLGIDRRQPGSQLASWMRLPWGVPRDMVLPSVPTAATTGLKGRSDGGEVFQLLCGLYAAGAQSVLVGRWPAGAFPATELAREFVQELDELGPEAAWQRSVELLWQTEIDHMLDPTIVVDKELASLPGEHPYFWAGYLLMDLTVPPPAGKDVPNRSVPQEADDKAEADGAAEAPRPMKQKDNK